MISEAALLAALSFSFTYGGRPSQELLTSWTVEHAERPLAGNRIQRNDTYTDRESGLVVRRESVEYLDWNTVEWTLHFKNTGSANTPIIEDIQALDARFECPAKGEFTLHHHTGSPYTPTDFRPFATPLPKRTEKIISTSGGRSSNSDFPYFNIEWPGGGVIVVIGWPGQWAARFTRDRTNGLRVRAGQELTRLTLHPGEEIRSPLVVLQSWTGDRVAAQNVWRRWMLAFNVPRVRGKLPAPQHTPCSSHQYGEMVKADEASQINFIDRYLEEGFKIDYWWMDAGWYVNKTGWPNTGTWEVDRVRFPRGLRAISDHAHSKGVRTIVWFEPERVTPGTWLYEQHPEWLLSSGSRDILLNLGNPKAHAWLVEHVSKLIREEGIDLYRNDFNMDPLANWRANDAPDRQGITEIRYVTGFLAYWDELRKRFPDMLIDTCASGGRRLDIETLRRSVPLTRSDWLFEPVSQQLHTYGLASWVPYYSTGTMQIDPYIFRSNMCPGIISCWDMRRKDLDYAMARRLVDQWRQVAPYYSGDYYPLTEYHVSNDVWMAWQFDRPDLGQGMVQVFRRAGSAYETARFPLRGLTPDATYEIRDLDAATPFRRTGRELAGEGLPVAIKERPRALVITYKRL